MDQTGTGYPAETAVRHLEAELPANWLEELETILINLKEQTRRLNALIEKLTT